MPGPFGFNNAFTSGELDDDTWDRTDLQQVARGCELALNLVPAIAGPLHKRPGFRLVGNVTDSAHATRLVAFRSSWDDTCMLELGDFTAYVWEADGTPRLDSVTGAQLHFGTPFRSDQLVRLRWNQVKDVLYFRSEGGMAPITLARFDFGLKAADWVFTTTTFTNGPWLAENKDLTRTVTFTNTGAPADVPDGNNTTGAGVIPAGAPVTIVSSIALFSAELVGSQLRVRANGDAVSCYAWAPAFSYFTGDFATSNGNMYVAEHLAAPGTSVKSGNNPPVQLQGVQSDGTIKWTFLHDGAGIVTLDSYVSPTTMHGTVYHPVPILSGVATSYWAFAAYSDADGWPTAWPEIREERLVDGGTSGNPDWADLTETAGFDPDSEDFTPGTGLGVIDDTNAVRRRIGTAGGKIQWFKVSTYLLAGTETGEYLITGPVLDEPISPAGVVSKELSTFGCAPIEPIDSFNGLMFVTITGQTLREIKVAENQVGGGEDHTVLAQHIAGRGFRMIRWLKSPTNQLWALLNDGGLACYTYHAEQQVKAWTTQQLAGGFLATDMQVLPGPSGAFEVLWLVATGPLGRVILQLAEPTSTVFMDLETYYAGPHTGVFPAPAVLEGQTVDVTAQGAWYPGLVVQGGQVTLPAGVTAGFGQIGLSYPVAFKSLKLDVRNQFGGTILTTQRISEALIDLKTVLCTVGGENPGWPGEDISARLPSDITPASARRMVRRVTIQADEDAEDDAHDSRIYITEQTPLDFRLYAIRQDKIAEGE